MQQRSQPRPPDSDGDTERLVLSPEEEKAYESRDLRTVAWRFLSEIRHAPEFLKLSAPAASMMRVIFALGDEPEDRAAAIAETAVIGSILHGIAPRDEDQWAIAERIYDDATLDDLRHWTPLMGQFGQAPRQDTAEFCSCGCHWRKDNDQSRKFARASAESRQ